MNPKFIHLRVHTNYSVGESSLNINNIVDLCKKYNFPAVGMADSGNLFGAREFSYKISSNGIKPLIGFEANVIYKSSKLSIEGNVVFIAKNELGYKNLLKIHDYAYLYKHNNNLESPKILFDSIVNFLDDIVILSGGLDGLLYNCVYNNLPTKDIEYILDVFKAKDFYIEINRFFTKKDSDMEKQFLAIAKDYNIPIVATNNVYFENATDFDATDILTCIKQGALQSDENRKIIYKESYFKSSLQMEDLYKDIPEALENTIKIAMKCNFFVDKKPLALPKFSENEEQQLKDQALQGLQIRLEEVYLRKTSIKKDEIEKKYMERLLFEINVIVQMGFCGYFLIVSDFIKWAKNNDIPVGPGRGSGAGSLVAWCLFITDVDPILFSLLFERFLNPERVSMPDFDIDFCQNGRDKVIDYVVNKYSKNRVAHIITFGTLQPRAAIKDVGRVMGLSYSEVDSISKKIPYTPPSVPLNLTKIINEVDALKIEIQNKEHIKHLFDTALKLEGLYRNISTHAAGVVISSESLNEIVPLYYDNDANLATVGFSMKYIEDVGLIKFDFLALKTLTIIKNAVKNIQYQENITLDMLKIPYEDTKISELLAKGDTLGVFQLESRGMTEVIKQLKPDKIEDIIAIISLYRPGPMENIPMYINRKHQKEQIEYFHLKMKEVLDETFGIMIYQEQVMQIAQVIAGYSLGGADILRRAMGKKDPKEMATQKNIFIEGAKSYNNIDKDISTLIFDQMEKFAGYGFNKSHATAYALVSWQTAYLKAYYPCEFLIASMSADIGNNNKEQQRFLEFVEEAKKYNISILPPSINNPCLDFIVEKIDNIKYIRYSLLSLKGMGENLVLELINQINSKGKFTSIEDFLQRINNKILNKRYLDSLIKSGSLDCIYSNRKELIENMDNLLAYNDSFFENKNSNQFGLFDNDSSLLSNSLKINNTNSYTKQEALAEELEIVGCFISGHPLFEYKEILEKQNIKSYLDIINDKINNAYLAGYLMKIKITKSKTGTNYANLTFYDVGSVFNIILIGDSYNKFFDKLKEGNVYILKTNIKIDDDEVRIFIENLEELNHSYKVKPIKTKNNKTINEFLNIEIIVNNPNDIKHLSNLLIQNTSGKDSITLKVLNTDSKKYCIYKIDNVMILQSQIEEIKQLNLDIIFI